MDKENIAEFLTTAQKLTPEEREKLLWIMQGILIAGQSIKNA